MNRTTIVKVRAALREAEDLLADAADETKRGGGTEFAIAKAAVARERLYQAHMLALLDLPAELH